MDSAPTDRPGAFSSALSASPPAPSLPIAQALYRLRRRRDRLFPDTLFSEPAWDLMLDLLAAEWGGTRVSITSACIATAAPTTTAMRCLKRLEMEGLVFREADANDKRRVHLRLSPAALAALEALFQDFHRLAGVAEALKMRRDRTPWLS